MKLKEILGIKEEKKSRSRLIAILTIFFIFVLLLLIIVMPISAYQYLYKDKIYLGVSIDGVNVGGLTREQARDKINQQIDNLKMHGLDFYFKSEKLNVDFTVISPTDPDLAFNILSFDTDAMVADAFAYGRGSNSLINLDKQIIAILKNYQVPSIFALNEKELRSILQKKFSIFDKPSKDASLKFLPDGQIIIEAESYGTIIDYNRAISDLKDSINLNSINEIGLKIKLDYPMVTKAEAETILPRVKQSLSNGKIILNYQDKKWLIDNDEFRKWLDFDKKDGQVTLRFNQDLLQQKLASIAQSINVLPQDARFEITDSKVTEFVPSVPGLELDMSATQDRINQDFFINKKTEINLIVKESEPKVKTGEANTFGIKELIGTGISDFYGSHVNRIKNIKNAVNHLSGILIPPGEFSLVDAIGKVDASTGYYPEFVIKGDRTIPEYGGGLCQIGTTMFRAALYSGLPITERQPHSYIVSYYKPIGMDATIYGPHPDLKFINDTGYYILLQIKIEGTKLIFSLWGASDGRKVEITDPIQYNWKPAPAPRMIENPDLKPGEKKLVEHARRGCDASFTRTITWPNGEKKEEVWRSHYQPWPDIYEIGVQPGQTSQTATGENLNNNNTQSGSSGNQNINSANN
jgi:vancomycin resistance protein YoaR